MSRIKILILNLFICFILNTKEIICSMDIKKTLSEKKEALDGIFPLCLQKIIATYLENELIIAQPFCTNKSFAENCRNGLLSFDIQGKDLAVGFRSGITITNLDDTCDNNYGKETKILSEYPTSAIKYCYGGKYLASVHCDYDIYGNLRIWNVEAKTCIKIFNDKMSTDIASCKGGRYIAGFSSHSIYICDVISGKIIKQLTDFKNEIISINFSKSGKYLVSGDIVGIIKVWDTKSFSCTKNIGIQDLTGKTWISKLIFDDKKLISLTDDFKKKQQLINIYDIQDSFKEKKQIVNNLKEPIRDIQSNGKYLIVGLLNGNIKIYSLETFEILNIINKFPLRFFQKGVTTLLYFKNGKNFFSAHEDGTLNIWRTEGDRLLNSEWKIDDITDLESEKNCQYCFATDCELRCSRCKKAYYCCQQCQKDDWVKHKVDCDNNRSH